MDLTEAGGYGTERAKALERFLNKFRRALGERWEVIALSPTKADLWVVFHRTPLSDDDRRKTEEFAKEHAKSYGFTEVSVGSSGKPPRKPYAPMYRDVMGIAADTVIGFVGLALLVKGYAEKHDAALIAGAVLVAGTWVAAQFPCALWLRSFAKTIADPGRYFDPNEDE